MKPKIKKSPSFMADCEAWECFGSGSVAWGNSPLDAYCKWRLKVKPLMVEE